MSDGCGSINPDCLGIGDALELEKLLELVEELEEEGIHELEKQRARLKPDPDGRAGGDKE